MIVQLLGVGVVTLLALLVVVECRALLAFLTVWQPLPVLRVEEERLGQEGDAAALLLEAVLCTVD